MSYRYNPTFRYTHEIVSALANAARLDEQLKSFQMPAKALQEINSLATIDAVHFSTKLEGNLMTYKQVTEVLNAKGTDWKQERNLLEVLNYSKTRAWLFKRANASTPLTQQLILKAHEMLLSNIVEGKLKGHFRDSQNVIKDSKSGGIVYLPPEASEVKPLINGLLSWIKNAELEGISPFLQAAVFHYQFVTIHPFLDGNGRLARVLTSTLLLANDMALPNLAAIEKYHEQNRTTYYRRLHDLQGHNFYDIPDNIDISSWILYWLEGLIHTYTEAIDRCQTKSETLKTSNENVSIAADHRLDKAETIFKKHKQLKAIDYQTIMGLGRTQAVSDLNKLVEIGVIERVGGGRTSSYKVVD